MRRFFICQSNDMSSDQILCSKNRKKFKTKDDEQILFEDYRYIQNKIINKKYLIVNKWWLCQLKEKLQKLKRRILLNTTKNKN